MKKPNTIRRMRDVIATKKEKNSIQNEKYETTYEPGDRGIDNKKIVNAKMFHPKTSTSDTKTIYPNTVGRAVLVNKGQTLESELSTDFIKAEDLPIVWMSSDYNTIPLKSRDMVISRNRAIDRQSGQVIFRVVPDKPCYVDLTYKAPMKEDNGEYEINYDKIDTVCHENGHVWQMWRGETGCHVTLTEIIDDKILPVQHPNVFSTNYKPNTPFIHYYRLMPSTHKDFAGILYHDDKGQSPYEFSVRRLPIYNPKLPIIDNPKNSESHIQISPTPEYIREDLKMFDMIYVVNRDVGDTVGNKYDPLMIKGAGLICVSSNYANGYYKLQYRKIKDDRTLLDLDTNNIYITTMELFPTKDVAGIKIGRPNLALMVQRHDLTVHTDILKTISPSFSAVSICGGEYNYIESNKQNIEYLSGPIFIGPRYFTQGDTIDPVNINARYKDNKNFLGIVGYAVIKNEVYTVEYEYDPTSENAEIFLTNRAVGYIQDWGTPFNVDPPTDNPYKKFRMKVPFRPYTIEWYDDGILVRGNPACKNNVKSAYFSFKPKLPSRRIYAYHQYPDHNRGSELTYRPYAIRTSSTGMFADAPTKIGTHATGTNHQFSGYAIKIYNPYITKDCTVNVSINPECNMDYDKIVALGINPVVKEDNGAVYIYTDKQDSTIRGFNVDLEIIL